MSSKQPREKCIVCENKIIRKGNGKKSRGVSIYRSNNCITCCHKCSVVLENIRKYFIYSIKYKKKKKEKDILD